ncbi:MlaD family protein [Oricola cellulosilytica]|uniref:MCE family protein n=1 Tax=Oricola cellulosilytica TaxID=1429082 RepID=A0A4R0P774_9HYPH|nr:MlaD family protein [Oricola cellulosilytica]TCD11789.1 MCE family protein [Oricola cellulosilytica]
METKANYVTVGAFTLLVFAAAFAFVYWIARVDTGGETTRLNVVIEGSVTGLGVGSVVKFNGIDVGKVTKLRFDQENPRVVIAETVVRRNLPITASTKAVLGFTGLTGIAHIEFEGGDTQQPNIFQQALEEGAVPTITADPSAVNNLLATAQDIFDRTDRVLSELEGFVQDVREPLSVTLQNASKFSEALGNNSDQIDEFLRGVGGVGAALADVSGKLDGTLQGVENLLAAVDPAKIKSIVSNVEGFTESLKGVSGQFEEVTKSVSLVVTDLEGIGARVNGSFDRVDAILDSLPPDQLNATLNDVTATSASARKAVAEIAAVTEGLGDRNEDVQAVMKRIDRISLDAEKFMANARAASGEFDEISQNASKLLADLEGVGSRVGTSFDRVDSLLDAIPPEQVTAAVENISKAGESARAALDQVQQVTAGLGERNEDIQGIISNTQQLADRLNAASVRVDGILEKVDNLLGSDEGESLMVDARETLRSFRQVADTLNARINSIANGLERFSDQGLRDVQGLINDTRRSVSRIEESITDLERNPQRLIFGGEGNVKTFDGRQRR